MKNIIIPINNTTRLVCKDWVNYLTQQVGIRVVIEKNIENYWEDSSTLWIHNSHMTETFDAIIKLKKLLILA